LPESPSPIQNVLELALLLRKAGFDETAERLEDAYDVETRSSR
jgi:hypothetical protein